MSVTLNSQTEKICFTHGETSLWDIQREVVEQTPSRFECFYGSRRVCLASNTVCFGSEDLPFVILDSGLLETHGTYLANLLWKQFFLITSLDTHIQMYLKAPHGVQNNKEF